jgi:hypothetical protein
MKKVKTIFIKSHWIWAVILSGFFSGPVCAPAQTSAGTEWSEEKLQEAFKQGVQATQKQEWLNALGYFEEVRRSVPLAPELLFNLALTEEALPGRELRALAWFKAYLAVAPEGPNAKPIEEACRVLELKVRLTLSNLLRQARQIAGRFPEDNARNQSLIRVFTAQAETGNFHEAEETVYQIESGFRDLAYQKIARLQAEADDIAGARKNLSYCNPRTCNNHDILIAIARAQARAGDSKAALSTLQEDRQWIDRYGQNKAVQYRESDALQAQLKERPLSEKKGPLQSEPLSNSPPVAKKASPEDQKKKAEAFTRFIDTRLAKPYFLNPESYFGFLATQSNPRERFEGLMEAALKMIEALKEFKNIDLQP